MSEEQSVLRTTLLGSLLDAAAPQPLARRRPTCGCSRSAPSTSTARAPGDADARATPLPDERTHLGALLAGALRPRRGATPEPPRATSSPPRACWRRCWTRSACRWAVEPARRAVPAPGPRRARARRRRAAPAGSASCTRSSRGAGTSSAPPASSSTSRVLAARARGRARATATSRRSRRVRQDLRVVVPGERRRRPTCSTVVREAGGALLRARRGLRRLPRRAGDAHVAGAAARVPRAPTAR